MADTPAKRFSAINIGSPWRGLHVVPAASPLFGERYAAMFLYSGIEAGVATPEPEIAPAFITSRRQGRVHRISGRLVGQGSVVTGEISVLPTGQDDIDLTALST